MVRQLSLSEACEGFIHYKRATGRSPHTILDYQVTLKKLRGFFKDNLPLASLSREKLIAFFAWLHEEYVSDPNGVAPRPSLAQVHSQHTHRAIVATDLGDQ